MPYLYHKYNAEEDKDGVGPLNLGDLPEPLSNFPGWLCWVVKWIEYLKCNLERCCANACEALNLAQQNDCKTYNATSHDGATNLNSSGVQIAWDEEIAGCTDEYAISVSKKVLTLNNSEEGNAEYQVYCSVPFTASATGVALSLHFTVNGVALNGKAYSPAVSSLTKPETVSLSQLIYGDLFAPNAQVRCVVNAVGGAGIANIVPAEAVLYVHRIR